MPYADRERQRRAQREWIARRRAAFFSGKTCAWCQAADELELHHRDPNKKITHAIWSWSETRRAAEIAKCIVLCRPCHDRAHAEAARVEAELRNPCGTFAAYKRGCHCRACKDANNEYNRARASRLSEAAA